MNSDSAHGAQPSTRLGLRSVLVGSLPSTLLTDHAPERYTVEAIFTRRPQAEEIVGIDSPQTHQWLVDAGYPSVEVSVSDRRFEIHNTSIEQLRDGLAEVLANRLADISDRLHAEQDSDAARLRGLAAAEEQRARAVERLAAGITFAASRHQKHPVPAGEGAPEQRWVNEGGHSA